MEFISVCLLFMALRHLVLVEKDTTENGSLSIRTDELYKIKSGPE